MPGIIVVYASLTGNTEAAMQAVVEGIHQSSPAPAVKVAEVSTVQPASLLSYDGILFGSYTWGDGELPDEYLDLYEDLQKIDLSGKYVSVFGTGDSSYEQYNVAVDILTERAKGQGAEIVLEGLKIENLPTGSDRELCREWGRRFAQHLTSVDAK